MGFVFGSVLRVNLFRFIFEKRKRWATQEKIGGGPSIDSDVMIYVLATRDRKGEEGNACSRGEVRGVYN